MENVLPAATAPASADPAYPYRNPDSLARWTRWSVLTQLAISIVSVCLGYVYSRVLLKLDAGFYESGEQATQAANAADLMQALVGLAQFAILVWSGVMVLRWIHRANWNARALGAEQLTITPGWAIGYYFIPFLNLWRPYVAMKEIWKANSGPAQWRTESESPLLVLWWTLWLINGFAGHAAFRMGLRADTLTDLINGNRVYMISDALEIPLCVVLLMIVKRVQSNQDSWAARAFLRQEGQ